MDYLEFLAELVKDGKCSQAFVDNAPDQKALAKSQGWKAPPPPPRPEDGSVRLIADYVKKSNGDKGTYVKVFTPKGMMDGFWKLNPGHGLTAEGRAAAGALATSLIAAAAQLDEIAKG